MYKAVLDTNVIVSALLKSESNPAFIVSLIYNDQIRFCLSEEIYDEYKGVLSRNKFKDLDDRQVKKLLKEMKAKALWVKPREKVQTIKRDPEDNKFLECAVEAQADYIITGNKKHFPFPKFRNTLIVTPADFIGILAQLLFED